MIYQIGLLFLLVVVTNSWIQHTKCISIMLMMTFAFVFCLLHMYKPSLLVVGGDISNITRANFLKRHCGKACLVHEVAFTVKQLFKSLINV